MWGQQIPLKIGLYFGCQNASQGLGFLFKLLLYSLVCILPLIFLHSSAVSYFSWISSQQEPTLLQLYKNLDNWNAPHHVFQSKSQQFSIYPLAANCPDIWSKLWLQLSGTGVCSVQINCFQTVCFICAIFLNTSLKTRLVRTLGYHLFSTKGYEFLHCFQNKWKIYFPGISLLNGNVSVLMQN